MRILWSFAEYQSRNRGVSQAGKAGPYPFMVFVNEAATQIRLDNSKAHHVGHRRACPTGAVVFS